MDLQSVIFFVFIGALCMFVVTGGYISMTSDADPSPTNLVSGAAVGGTVGAVFAMLQQKGNDNDKDKDTNTNTTTDTNTNTTTTTGRTTDTNTATSKLLSHVRDFMSGGSSSVEEDTPSLKMKVGLPSF